jgi:DNA-binding GntR family transcriptional regulator
MALPLCFAMKPEILHTKSSQTAADDIARAIIEGRFEPGARLKEGELAETLGISRTPIREALLLLTAKGLVEMSPNRGARVRSYDESHLDDLYELRALLEGHVARLAARRADSAQQRTLDESCSRFDSLVEAGDDFPALVEENGRFHGTLVSAARDPRLAEMLATVVEVPLLYRAFTWYSPEQLRASGHFHRQIARAVKAGDGERAERIMKEHILDARDVLIARLDRP